MSLEQAILDRLEKRNAQIAQLQSTIQALERAADAEREHARQQLAPLIKENKKLAARIDDSEVIERRERLIKSLNDEITKRDNELREIDSASKAHREALQAKEDEIQEWLAQLERARQERDAALLEVARLRAEVPLESTREALKKATAELNPIKSALKVVHAVCGQYGMADGELLHDFITRIGEALGAERTRADNLATCRDRWMKIAADCGRMDGEDAGEFIARLAQQSAQGAYLAVKVEELRFANIKQEQELEELRAFAKADNKRHGDLRDEMTSACNLATSCGMRGDESLRQFVERICGKVVSLTTELQCANDEADDMRKRWIKLNDHARMKGMEGSEGVAEFITRLQHMAADRKTALDRAAETIAKMGTGEVVKHPVIDWQFVAVSLQNEIARLNAKLGPLEKLYEVVKKHVDHGAIIDNRADIYDAVAETAKALSQLTA